MTDTEFLDDVTVRLVTATIENLDPFQMSPEERSRLLALAGKRHKTNPGWPLVGLYRCKGLLAEARRRLA